MQIGKEMVRKGKEIGPKSLYFGDAHRQGAGEPIK